MIFVVLAFAAVASAANHAVPVEHSGSPSLLETETLLTSRSFTQTDVALFGGSFVLSLIGGIALTFMEICGVINIFPWKVDKVF